MHAGSVKGEEERDWESYTLLKIFDFLLKLSVRLSASEDLCWTRPLAPRLQIKLCRAARRPGKRHRAAAANSPGKVEPERFGKTQAGPTSVFPEIFRNRKGKRWVSVKVENSTEQSDKRKLLVCPANFPFLRLLGGARQTERRPKEGGEINK